MIPLCKDFRQDIRKSLPGGYAKSAAGQFNISASAVYKIAAGQSTNTKVYAYLLDLAINERRQLCEISQKLELLNAAE